MTSTEIHNLVDLQRESLLAVGFSQTAGFEYVMRIFPGSRRVVATVVGREDEAVQWRIRVETGGMSDEFLLPVGCSTPTFMGVIAGLSA